ncbi:hypothetical protein GCM10023205_52580 [Yinghuangia aomiensis]|uniref:FtsK domain-containing protein n=1 Tax=Yinghuangia aomiensis TaxID=676205 RepID=A0ABP9HU49_9ACTN
MAPSKTTGTGIALVPVPDPEGPPVSGDHVTDTAAGLGTGPLPVPPPGPGPVLTAVPDSATDTGPEPARRTGDRDANRSWEIELPGADTEDDAGAANGSSVDLPANFYPPSMAEQMKAKDAARKPVIPDWLTVSEQRQALLKWTVDHYTHTGAYHAVRAPWYASKLTAYAPRGVWRWLNGLRRWVFDAEGQPLRAAAVANNDADQYFKLTKSRDSRVRARGTITGLGAVAGGLVAAAAAMAVPGSVEALMCAAGVTAAGFSGAPADRPIVEGAQVKFRYRKLTSDIVERAFEAAGLTTAKLGISFPRPIVQDGDGWRVVVDLPYGNTFAQAVRARDKLASGIDVAETQVFLDPDPSSSRRVSMWVANQDPLAVSPGRTPLLAMDRVDFWEPFAWGVDERGNDVMASMLWLSMLIGAVPRQGKTFSARTIALAAALDPWVRLYVFDGKASPDWRGFKGIAHRTAFGVVPYDGTDPAAHVLASLEELKADVESRYHRLSELPVHICPEGKLTPAISRDPKYDMPLTLIVVDEVQEYLQHPIHGKRILELLVFLARVAPAVGVAVLLSTQKPDDKACPSVLRDQCQVRFALRVGSYHVSETILGAGSYPEGLDASRLLRSHKGVGILRGMSDEAGIVRTYLADGGDAHTILARARALREDTGTLSGDAAGERTATEGAATVLEDVAMVMPRGKDAAMWSDDIADALAELRPDVYGAWADLEDTDKARQVGSALKPFGVTPKPIGRRVDGKTVTRYGVRGQQIHEAITQRNGINASD